MSSHVSKKTKTSKINCYNTKFGHEDSPRELNNVKKIRTKKENESTKYEMLKKPAVTDYTDVAYREAVSRLRYLLNESYYPSSTRYSSVGADKQEESDEESKISPGVPDRTKPTRLSPYRRPYFPRRYSKPLQQTVPNSYNYGEDDLENSNQLTGSPELMAFIARQDEYIDQLEKEAQYCRDELSNLLGKVKELISENESLQEQQKTGLMKVMLEGVDDERFQSPKKYKKNLEGPMIVFESRISELEAQLTQCKVDLRKAQEETEMYKQKLLDCQPSSSNYDFYKQIENLQREKKDLNESLAKLQASINQIREKEMDASKKVQRTLDVVDKTQFEKQQAELEVYRLKSELELQHDKLLNVLSEQTRKVADERTQAERRYQQHIERLNAELTMQRDSVSKLQMELEKYKRIEEDLRRDLNAKNLTIENVKKELNNKIGSLQKELASALAERDSMEQELNSSKMSSERVERMNKQESNRMQVEISSLKKRLDGGDVDLIHCRKENLRLLEKISDLEKDLTLYKIKLGEQKDPIEDEEQKAREKIMNSRISEIEAKHVEKVSDLEGLIENQSQVMAQLKAECQSLTQKLEESTARHKLEMENLQSHLNQLNSKMDSNFGPTQLADGTSKEPEVTVTERNYYQTSPDDKKFDAMQNDVNSNKRFLNEESRQSSSYAFDNSYESTKKEQPYQNFQQPSGSNPVYGNSGGNEYEPNKNGSTKQENQNSFYDGQTNNYSKYYGNEPTLNYTEQSQQQQPQQQQPPLQDINQLQQQSYQEQIPFQERQSFPEQPTYVEQTLYQEQPGYQEKSNFQDQQKFKEQPHYEEKLVTQDQIFTEESYNSDANAPSQPSSIQSVEPAEVTPPEPKLPEPKPPPSDPPKTTASQRFQRAAELSRQASKSEDSPSRGKLISQARARNAQLSRNQPKTQSRFK